MTDNTKDFWEFSLQIWQQEEIRECLLNAQDRMNADCNIFLLFLWAIGRGYLIQNHEDIYKVSSDHQRAILRPLRQARIGLKGTDIYGDSKDLELKAEKLLQSALIEAAHLAPSDKLTNQERLIVLSEQCADYLTYLSVLNPEAVAQDIAGQMLA